MWPEGRAYLDHASTSRLRPSARAAMVRWADSADPARVHTEGRLARAALEDARERVAALLGSRPRQIVFTSGGTEAVNAAVHGALAGRGGTAALAGVEHSAVREASRRYAGRTVELAVDATGRIDLASLHAELARPGVDLVHCQWANHELGTLQPVEEVVSACRRAGVVVHVDAAAAAGHVPIRFDDLGADLMSVSAHKLGGPAGIGALAIRRGLRLPGLVVGGDQERGRRGGLENLPGAAGFAAAAEELYGDGRLGSEAAAAEAQVALLERAACAVEGVAPLGPRDRRARLPHILCLAVAGVEAEAVVMGLDRAGVAAHSGSACSSEALEPSPVLAAIGADADHSLRLSVGWSTTDAEVSAAAARLGEVVGALRALRRSGEAY